MCVPSNDLHVSNLGEGGGGSGVGVSVRFQLPSVRSNMPSVPGSTDLLSRTTGAAAASRHYLPLSSRLACPPPTSRFQTQRETGEDAGGAVRQSHRLPAATWRGPLILLL